MRGEWRAIAGAVLLDLAISPLFAWDVFTPVLGEELPADDAGLSAVFSVGLAAFTVGVLLGGRAADLVAPRRLALLTAAGAGFGLVTGATTSSLAVLIAGYGVVFGGVTGLGYVTAVRVAGTVATRRGLALGLVVSAYAGGTIVVAPVAAALLAAVGRRPTFLLLAVFFVTCLLAAAALLSGVSPRRSRASRATRSSRRGRPGSRHAGWRVAVLAGVFGLGSAPGLAAFAHAGDVAGPAATAVTLLSVGNLGGRLLAGPLSDRLGRPASLHGAMATLVAVCAVLGFAAGDGPVALAALLVLGAQYGALSALAPAATADIVLAERYGGTFGLVFVGWGTAGLTAPVAAVWLAAVDGFGTVFLAALGVAALAWAGTVAFSRDRAAPPRSTLWGAFSRSVPHNRNLGGSCDLGGFRDLGGTYGHSQVC